MSEFEDWDALQRSLPANRTPLVDECIRVLRELPGVSKSSPSGPRQPGEIPINLVHLGFPFTFLCDVPSLDPMRAEAGRRIASGQLPAPSDAAEISAAALVKALGAGKIERVNEEDTRTADFRVWWEGDLIEMEVTRADPKQTRIERTEAVSRMKSEIMSFGRSCDLVIHVANIGSSRLLVGDFRAVTL